MNIRSNEGPTDADFRAIFDEDKRGAAILDHLLVKYPPKVVTDGGIDAVLKTYRHAAQRELLEYIVRRINRANGVPDSNAEHGE